jgi:nucleoside-diphosphate-sugar epimerase
MLESPQPFSPSCLVTGGAGFVGSHLVAGLIAKGCKIRVLDNLSTGKMENILPYQHDIEFIEGDIRDLTVVKAACEGIEVVLHHAAIASVAQSIKNPQSTHEVNVDGTFNILEGARHAGVKKIIFASTAAVYGVNSQFPTTEESVIKPISPYGLSKLIGEQYCELFSDLYAMDITCFRYFNIYGPRQNTDSHYSGVISTFFKTIISGESPVLYGDGLQSRDFVHVEDITQACILALIRPSNGFGVYNVASGKSYSVLDILNWIKEHVDQDFEIQKRADRRGDIRHSMTRIDKIKVELGFKPQKQFYQGLKELFEYMDQAKVPC